MFPRALRLSAVLLLLAPATARAGMTSYTLDSLVELRLQDISFFITLVLACALGFRLLWSWAFKSLPQVPRLNYRQSLVLTLVLGLTMLLVLSMISGARELLTPGAWQRQGNGYKLSSPVSIEQRQARLLALWQVLKAHADTHGGQWPAHAFVPEIPASIWQAPDEGGSRYVYLGGLLAAPTADAARVVAFEPPNFDEPRLGVTADGKIRELSAADVKALLETAVSP